MRVNNKTYYSIIILGFMGLAASSVYQNYQSKKQSQGNQNKIKYVQKSNIDINLNPAYNLLV